MFREMSETELIIRDIDDVRMISIYELTGMGDEPGEGCAAISVFYGTDRHINLCELDEGFDLLADRVFEIYGELEDKTSIVLDDRTRRILESGWLTRDEGFLDKYYEMQPVIQPKVAFEASVVRQILPIVEYLLEAVYKVLGIRYEITVSKPGWRGAGVIYGMLDGSRIVSGVSVTQNTKEEYAVRVNNFIEQGNVLDVIVNIGYSAVIIEYACPYRDIHGTGIFNLQTNGYSEFHETFRDGKKIFRDSRDMFGAEPAVLTEEEKALIPWDFEESAAVGLPFEMAYIIRTDRTGKNACVIDEYRDCFLYRRAQFSESRCWTKVKNNGTKFSLKTSSVVMYTMALRKGERQVFFVPSIGNHKDRYRNNLEGRCFVISKQ